MKSIFKSAAALLLINTVSAKPKNVLFVAVDDLRVELACYGASHMKTPHIDKLASEGLLFERAYCQQAICGPSRISLLTGMRPDTTKAYSLQDSLDKTLPDALTLPQHFKENGYKTISLGKIYHHSSDDKDFWDVLDRCDATTYANPESAALMEKLEKEGREKGLKGKELRLFTKGPAYESADVPDETYYDGVIAKRAIEELKKGSEKPLFLAVGFKKPHLPFVAPKKYWDLYKKEDIAVPARKAPTGVADQALTSWGELRAYNGTPKEGPCSDELTQNLIHGYRACVSYVDAQLGRVLAELEKQGLRDDTIVVLWGDHGWKLGDYGCWNKHTNFELDTRVPLIFSGPGIPKGKRTKALTEFVDIYPTLADYCSLEIPKHCEGISSVPLFKDPAKPWKKAAFSQYPRGGMGYSIRSEKWRYTEWRNKKGAVLARELYDHSESDVATVNLIDAPEHADTVKKMEALLKAGPKAARP